MKKPRIKIPSKGILGLQLAMLVIVGFETVGAGWVIPLVVKSLIGFVYLTFVPGFLILKILQIQEIGSTKIILYSVGLSIAFLIFLGFSLDITLPDMGVSRPISYIPLVGSVIGATFILYVLSLVRGMNHPNTMRIDFRQVVSSSLLPLLLLPLMSILGTYVVNVYENNIVLLLLIVAIVCAVIMVSRGRIPSKLYPLALFLIAVSLLYHRSLITNYLIGWDIHGEYYEYNLVKASQYWSLTRTSQYGSILSISVLPTIYSFFLNMDGVWIYKIIFPFLFALVPVGLFEVFRKQLDDKAAFLSSFFFMSFFSFFQEMLQVAREQVAELLFVLCFLAMIETRIRTRKRTLLLLVFGASVVLSHYVIAFAFAGYIVSIWLVTFLRNVYSGKGLKKEITGLYVTFFVVLTLCWYMFVSNAVILVRLSGSFSDIFWALRNFFEIQARHPTVQQALGAAPMASLGRELGRMIFYGINLFILVGTLKLAIKPKSTRFGRTFIVMAFINLALLVASLLLPFFPQILNATRIYHIALMFLAPSCILGGEVFFKILERVFRISKRHFNSFILIILLSFFLFNTGFIFEVTGDAPSSMSLSKYRLDGPYFSDEEVLGAKWLVNRRGDIQSVIYGDEYGWLIFLGYVPFQRVGAGAQLGYFTNETEQVPTNTYVFLRYFNVKEKQLRVRPAVEVDSWEYINITSNPACFEVITNGLRIYDNGYCNVFFRG